MSLFLAHSHFHAVSVFWQSVHISYVSSLICQALKERLRSLVFITHITDRTLILHAKYNVIIIRCFTIFILIIDT